MSNTNRHAKPHPRPDRPVSRPTFHGPPPREVYVSTPTDVKWTRLFGCAALATLAMLGQTACRSPRFDHEFALFGAVARLDAATPDTLAGLDTLASLETDLNALAAAGINTVIFLDRHAESVAPDPPPTRRLNHRLTTAAEAAGLHAAVTDPDIQNYVVYDRLPVGLLSPAPLALNARNAKADILYLGEVIDDAGARRLREITKLHHAESHVPLTLATIGGEMEFTTENLGVSLLCTSASLQLGDTPDADPTPQGNLILLNAASLAIAPNAGSNWLGVYHQGLSQGRVAGVILTHMSGANGWANRLPHAETTAEVRAAAGYKRLRERVRRWGPRLRDCHAEPIIPPPPAFSSGNGPDATTQIQITRFTSATRQFILLFNPSDHAFVRNHITITCEPGLSRFVEIPVDAMTIVGHVHHVSGGRVTLKSELAPLDARLYEVF